MLTVAQRNYIKELREFEDANVSEIARRMQIDWRTAKKYADGECAHQEQPKQRRVRQVMEEEHEQRLRAWIEEDLRRPRKYRRKGPALYHQLKEETSFSGSDRTVRYYAKKIKAELARKEPYVRLDHAPGTAQVDFGDTLAILAGDESHERVAHKLVMSFPYSNDSLTRHLPAENAECFLTGLKSMFEELGANPHEIWFDNLPAAVSKMLQGENRELTALFTEFRNHFWFKAVFCNKGKGNEKGNVENKVGTQRRNCDSPPRRVSQWSELDEKANLDRERRRKEPHYLKPQTICELFDEDKANMRALPEKPFIVASIDTAVINKTGEAKVRNELYHIPGSHIGQKVFARVHAYHIDFYDEHGEILLSSQTRKYALEGKEIDWVAELECYRNKPRAIEYATYLKNLPPVLMQYLLTPELTERRQRLHSLISLLREHPLKQVEKSITVGLQSIRTDYASLKSIILHLSDQKALPQLESYTPRQVVDWRPNLRAYDSLTGGGLE